MYPGYTGEVPNTGCCSRGDRDIVIKMALRAVAVQHTPILLGTPPPICEMP